MDIINAHVHAIDLPGMLEKYPSARLDGDIPLLKNIQETIALLDPRCILDQMDKAGIAKSVLYAVEAPLVYASNEYVGALCKAYPDRFIGFASVDPKRPDAVSVLERALHDYGLKGIKLHPPLQNFVPNDKKYYPIYEAAQNWEIPIVFHVGTTPFGCMCSLKQADPMLIDDIAIDFPRLRIMLTHLGTLWNDEAFMVVEKNPNVYIDTAAYLYEIPEIMTESLVQRIGPHKFIFGTDFPMPSPPHTVHCMKDFVEVVRSLALSEEIKQRIFSQNFLDMIKPRDACVSSPSLMDVVKGLGIGVT